LVIGRNKSKRELILLRRQGMGKYFGTDGFRGEANVNLTVEHAYKVGRFLGWFYGKNHEDGKAKIVIGKDTRRSSYMFEYSLVAGLTASGADPYLLHVTTTPSVSYVVRTEDFDCGIMISASHNPYYDNGIKLINDKGEKMREDVIDQIEKYLEGDMEEIPFATREKIGCTVDYVAGRNRYMGYLMSLAVFSFKGMRVGLDAANGSAWTLAKSIFDALGAKTYVIHADPDGTNINTNCGSTHIESLQELVKREHLDVGFAFDGDADRCLCVDENGDVVNGDHILYVYGCYMKKREKLVGNKVVTTVMSNFGLYKAFDAAGIEYEKTAVGDKYVYECMSENGYRIGGEQSGHIIFSKYATTGDGIITALKMMQVIMDSKKTLSQLTAPLVIYPQVLKNIRVTDKTEAQNDADVKAAVDAVAEKLGENGRILVRESGTEPVVRVMVEADTTETCEKYVEEVIEVIKSKGYAVG
jgi:phosphoglucosamine mutase